MEGHGEARAEGSPRPSKAPKASRDTLLTRVALALFIAGFILGSLRFFTGVVTAIEILGPLVTLAGIALLVLGRRSFGRHHALTVLMGAVVYVALLAIFLAWAASFSGSIQDIVYGGLYTPGSLEDLLTTQVLLQAVVNGLLGLPLLLFVLELEDRLGRFLAFMAAAIAIPLNMELPLLILPSLRWIVTNSNNLRPVQFNEFEANLNQLTALTSLVNLPWIAAYAIAFRRVSRHGVHLQIGAMTSEGKPIATDAEGQEHSSSPRPLIRERGAVPALALVVLFLAGVSLGMGEASRQPHIEVTDLRAYCGPGPTNLTYNFTLGNSGTANGYATTAFYETQQFARVLRGTQRYFVPVGAGLTREFTAATAQCNIQSSAPFAEITAVEKG
jgi:hypothetical protein